MAGAEARLLGEARARRVTLAARDPGVVSVERAGLEENEAMEKAFAQSSHHSCTPTKYRVAVVQIQRRAAAAAAALLTLPVGVLQQLQWTCDMTYQLGVSAPVAVEGKLREVLRSALCCNALMVL